MLLLVFSSLSTTEGRHRRSGQETLSSVVDADVCTRLIQQIYHGHVTAPDPPDVTGVWASER